MTATFISILVLMGLVNAVILVLFVRDRYRKKKPPVDYKPNKSQHLADDKPVTTLQDIQDILADITFKPSCVDMNWKWECKSAVDGYMLRTCFRRPERNTGDIAEGFGRWWFVPNDVSLSGVVKTAYKAAWLILEHELMESFKWRGKRIFNPHNSVVALAALSDEE